MPVDAAQILLGLGALFFLLLSLFDRCHLVSQIGWVVLVFVSYTQQFFFFFFFFFLFFFFFFFLLLFFLLLFCLISEGIDVGKDFRARVRVKFQPRTSPPAVVNTWFNNNR